MLVKFIYLLKKKSTRKKRKYSKNEFIYIAKSRENVNTMDTIYCHSKYSLKVVFTCTK